MLATVGKSILVHWCVGKCAVTRLDRNGCCVLFCFVCAVICRQMIGIHWRMDGQEGLLLGEIAGVRILQQVRDRTHPKQPPTMNRISWPPLLYIHTLALL